MINKNSRRCLTAFALAACLSGCAIGQQKTPSPDAFDLGPEPLRSAPASGKLPGTLMVSDVAAPPWLDTTSMFYRLAYIDGAKVQAYAHSRWVASAPDMITTRLRARLAEVMAQGAVTPSDGARGETQLKFELDEFDHVFDAPGSSKVVMRARGTLIKRLDRSVIAQRGFLVELPAAPNAPGAVKAFSSAVDQFSTQVVDWVSATIGSRNTAPTVLPGKPR